MTVAPAKPTQKFLDMQKAAHQKIADERDKALKKLEKIEESQNKSKKAGQLKSRVAEGTANASNASDKAIDQYGIFNVISFGKRKNISSNGSKNVLRMKFSIIGKLRSARQTWRNRTASTENECSSSTSVFFTFLTIFSRKSKILLPSVAKFHQKRS